MAKLRLALAGAVVAVLASVSSSAAPTWPDHVDHYLNDFAGLLQPAERDYLNGRLRDLEARTTNQVVVAIFQSLDGEDRDDLTNRLFKSWKIGQKGKDNGVLLTVFVQDRKTKIEVGYGAEALLTDAMSSRILRDDIAPAFRAGRYAEGITAAVDDIASAITTGEVPRARRKRGSGKGIGLGGIIVIIIIIILASTVGGGGLLGALLGASMTANRRGWSRGSGGWGGGWGGLGGGGGGGWGGGGGGGGGGFSGGGGMSGGGGAGGGW